MEIAPLDRATSTLLFSILGTTYGGNGTTTFALPDLRGRVPMQPGQGPGSQPHQNMQPFLAVNYIIALQGIYPSRN